MNAVKVFGRVCRVCLNDCSRLINIFNNSTVLNDAIVNVLMSCVPLQVSKGDGLPTFICRPCYRKLKMSNQFQKLAMKSDGILRQHLENAKQSDFDQDDCLCNEDRCFLVSNKFFDVESFVDVTLESDIESMNCWDQQSLNDQLAACFKAIENAVAENENPVDAKSDNAAENLMVNIKKEIDEVMKFDETKNISCDVDEDVKFKIEVEDTEEMRSDTEVNSICCETKNEKNCMNLDERNSKEQNDSTLELLSCVTKQKKDAVRGENFRIDSKTELVCSDLNRIENKNILFGCKNYLNMSRRISKPKENKCTVSGESSKDYLKPKDRSEYTNSNFDKNKRIHSGDSLQNNSNANLSLKRRSNGQFCPGEKPQADLVSCDVKEKNNRHLHSGETPSKTTEANPYLRFDETHRGNSEAIAEPKDDSKVTLFRCDICAKCFNQLKNLRIHKRLAHNEKPCYECDICGKHLAGNRSLTDHKRRHSGDKPFECLICKKGFIDKSELIKHKLVHTRDKLFQCDVCARFYTLSSSLSAHKRLQHNLLKTQQR